MLRYACSDAAAFVALLAIDAEWLALTGEAMIDNQGAVWKQVLRLRHPRESGDPRAALASRLRGNDESILLFRDEP
jgi:hypothetical protein